MNYFIIIALMFVSIFLVITAIHVSENLKYLKDEITKVYKELKRLEIELKKLIKETNNEI